MEQNKNDIKLGRFLSLVLRHDPQAAGISLDEHGWAKVDELLSGVRHTGRSINMETLERIVRENNKQRYSFNEDHTKIRANQGHSIQVDVELTALTPPAYLYHGTATRFLPAIQREGIQKMGRQYVHLSGDVETAEAVGRRHGKPAVIRIDAEAMARDGITFYRSENGVWLCEAVLPKYFDAQFIWRDGDVLEEKQVRVAYDKRGKIPTIRSSICTGEQVAGFKVEATGKFQELMLIRNDSDYQEFLRLYDVTEDEIKREW